MTAISRAERMSQSRPLRVVGRPPHVKRFSVVICLTAGNTFPGFYGTAFDGTHWSTSHREILGVGIVPEVCAICGATIPRGGYRNSLTDELICCKHVRLAVWPYSQRERVAGWSQPQ